VAAPSPARGNRDAPLRSATAPPRGGRFGSPLVLSRVHWVRPEMVVEVSYAEWTPDGLLRHVVYLGEREDKPAIEVRRPQS
jgi:ATP-dependent DNA ligase